MPKLWIITTSLGIGLVAGLIATYIQMPLPWMLGPLIATMVISLYGKKLIIPGSMRTGSRYMVGAILGATVTVETLRRVPEWPVSLVALLVGAVMITVLCTAYLYRVAGYDRMSALSASLPGAISTIPMVAIALGADARRVVMPHLLRVTLIVMIVPPLYSWWQGVSLVNPSGAGNGFDWWGDHLWILVLALPGWWLARWLRFPIPELTGPMLIAAACSLSGYRLVLPDWLFALTFLVLGSAIGVRFFGMSLGLLASVGRHALICTVITLSITLIVAWGIHILAGFDFHIVLLAVMPGGIAEMTILAAALGVDPVFVAFHQIVRSMLLNLVAPYVIQWFGQSKE